MPSSPEVPPTGTAPWEPAELRAAPARPEPPTGLPLFEVAGTAAVPARLLADARAAARAEGWSAGWADGMRAADGRAAAEAERNRAEQARQLAERRAETTRAVAALDAAAAGLERQALPTVGELQALLLESAFAIAEALVGHALRDDATRAPAALARVLALAPAGEPVTVRLHPADHALLADARYTADRAITLVADAALAPGDAVATSGATEIDARIRAGVDRVRGVLAP